MENLTTKINELRADIVKILANSRTLIENSEKEGRNALNVDENLKYNAMIADIDTKRAQVKILETQYNLEKDMAQSEGRSIQSGQPGQAQENIDPEMRRLYGQRAENTYIDAFMGYLRNNNANNPKNQELLMQMRSQTVGVNADGGYLVPGPVESEIIMKLKQANVIRQYATVQTVNTDKSIPVENAIPTFGWIDETGAYPETGSTFGKVNLSSNKCGGIIKVSEELLFDSGINLPAFLGEKISQGLGRIEEEAFITGNGVKKPTGITTNATLGKTTASASAIIADEIIDLFYSLTPPYRSKAVFVMNDSTVAVIAKLKEATTGGYLWQPGFRLGEPDTLKGKLVVSSEYMPTITNSAVVALFGDLSYYHIIDRYGIAVQRLNELYAANGFIGFKANHRTDGCLTLPEAVKTLTMKA